MAAFKALMRRELILVQRVAFVYVFKAVQSAIVALIVATLFLRTHIHPNNARDASLMSGLLFFSLLQTFFSGVSFGVLIGVWHQADRLRLIGPRRTCTLEL